MKTLDIIWKAARLFITQNFYWLSTFMAVLGTAAVMILKQNNIVKDINKEIRDDAKSLKLSVDDQNSKSVQMDRDLRNLHKATLESDTKLEALTNQVEKHDREQSTSDGLVKTIEAQKGAIEALEKRLKLAETSMNQILDTHASLELRFGEMTKQFQAKIADPLINTGKSKISTDNTTPEVQSHDGVPFSSVDHSTMSRRSSISSQDNRPGLATVLD